MVMLSTGFFVFGWSVDHIGFIPGTAMLVFLGALAGREFRIKEVIVLMIVMIIGCWALFIKGLELPFPLFWWR
jgi:membrane protein DedA with SNARE-associated domain